jgi:hypothetical protein
MGTQIGQGYIGSANLETSVANVEILPTPSGWSTGMVYTINKFSFYNTEACHITINDASASIYLRAGQGFSTDITDKLITSFKIVENNIHYNWIANY